MSPTFFSRVKDTFHKMVSSDDELAAEHIAQSAANEGAQSISSAKPRQTVSFLGEIESVTLAPSAGPQNFEADLFDGSGHITLVWMGRAYVPGIKPGCRLRAQGRLVADKGRLLIFNPRYDLQLPSSDSE